MSLLFTGVGAASGSAPAAYEADAIYTPLRWYEARKETAFSDTDPVSTVTDFGSVGVDPTSVTTARATYRTGLANGYPAFVFDGGDGYDLTSFSPGASDFTIALRLKPTTSFTNGMMGYTSGSQWQLYVSTATNLQTKGAATINGTISQMVADSFYTVYLVKTGGSGSAEMFINNVSVGSGTVNTFTSLVDWCRLGSGFQIDACEHYVYAMYSQIFTSDDRAAWHAGMSSNYS
jgi:hypothetical protein